MEVYLLPRGGYDPYNSVDGHRAALRALARKMLANIRYGKFITTRSDMKKRDEIEQPNSCLNKAADHEPLFVLRGKDAIAPEVVEKWAQRAEELGIHEPRKIAEARALANQMREWREDYMVLNRAGIAADAANRGDPDRVEESRTSYGLDQAATMEAIRLREERKNYKMSAAMMAGGTLLASMVRENEGEPLTDKQLREAADNAAKFAEFLAVEMLDKQTA